MKIGVTGGAGFIGGHVVDELARRGHEPVIFDHLGRTARSEIPECYRPVLMGDVRDPVAMCELAAHVDGIIHLAACLGTQETIKNPRPAAETNVQGGLNFLEAIAQYDIPGVYIGVGNHWMNNTYSISKTTVERFVAMFNKERGTRCNIVRLVNAYGPYQSVAPPFGPAKVKKITPSFVCRALTGQPVEVYGDGEQVSDMVHVTDGAKGLVTAMEKAAAGVVFDKAVEVGPADHRTVNEVAQQVIKAAVGLGYSEVPIKHEAMRPGEIPGAVVSADISTLPLVDMTADGLVDLETGIADVVAWYAKHWLPQYKASR